jgi:hypothetical protein
MALLKLPEPFAKIDEIAEQGDYAGARSALASLAAAHPSSQGLVDVLDVKLGLLEGTLAPQIAMNRLLALMRQDAKLPGAHELYKAASQIAYEEHSSSLSHSHPPPPMKPKDGPTK